MSHRFRRAVLALLLALTAGAAFAAPALAAGQPAASTTPAWGQPCQIIGSDGYTPGGTHLVCAQARGDDCPRWHNPDRGKGKGGWVRPSTSPCPCGHPSGTPSPSAAPSLSVSTPVSPSLAASGSAAPVVGVGGWASAGRLPVTGFDAGDAVAFGVVLIAAGVLLVVRHRRRRVGP